LVVSAQHRQSPTSFRQVVFSRQSELQSVSEPVADQAPLVVWRPIGNVIASVQRASAAKLQVIFFERNGLRHGEFSLPLAPRGPVPADAHALQVDYSADSEVLAVLLGDAPSAPGRSYLLLYTQNNYHYSLKFALCLGTSIRPIWPTLFRLDHSTFASLHL
jgi:elongator complex protein 1